jgi:hypothetical protein
VEPAGVSSTPEGEPPVGYVFGYASLVALDEPRAAAGRLLGFRRFWGTAMNNWEPANDGKYFRDRRTPVRPRIRVAYLDIRECDGSAVNGLALPVDSARLAAFDAREVNYDRIDVSAALEPALALPVFAYVGTEAARGRCRQGAADANAFVSRDYAELVRRGFAALGAEAEAEFEASTDPLPFPERDLDLVQPGLGGGEAGDWGSGTSSRSI